MALGEEIGEAYVSVRYDTRSLEGDARRAAQSAASEFGDEFERRFGDRFDRLISNTTRDSETEFTRSGQRSGDNFNRGFLGRLRGARNDFANIVGVIGGGIERGVGKLFDGITTGVGGALDSIGQRITSFSGGSGPLGALGSGLSSAGEQVAALAGKGGLVGLAVSLGVAVLAFEAFLLVLGPVAGGLSAIVGIVAALASALTFALAGALLSLGPIIGSLVVGIGGVADAFIQLSDPLDDQNNLMKEFSKQFNALEDKVFKGLPSFSDFVGIIKDLFSALDPLVPLFQDAVNAVVDWVKNLGTAVNGGDMKKAIGVFDKTWPDILTNLLDTFTSIFTGIIGVMRAISPIVADVTGSISGVADQFSKWANSTEGQKTITDFFEKARDAASTLWGIIKNVGTVIGEVFGGGEELGQGFLDKIEDITGSWATFLGTEKGQKDLKQWFSDAKDLAESLGGALSQVADFFDELDTPANRKMFSRIVTGIQLIITAIQLNYEQMKAILDGIHDAFFAVVDGIEAAVGAVASFFAGLPAAWDSATTAVAETIGGWITTIEDTISGIWDGILDGLSTAWDGVVSYWNTVVVGFWSTITAPMREFWSSFWSALSDQLSPKWDAVVSFWNSTVVPWFSGIATWVAKQWSAFWHHIGDGLGAGWARVTSWWNSTVVSWFSSKATWVGGRWTALWHHIGDGLSAGWARVTGWWNSTVVSWFSSKATWVGGRWTALWHHIGDGISAGWDRVTGWWSKTVAPWFDGLPAKLGHVGGDIVGSILNGIINSFWQIPQWIGSQLSNLHFNIGSSSFHLPFTAAGGTFAGAQARIIGEAGPEAVVPLNRNLNQVDPSVRWLSAIAQGKTQMASGGVVGGPTIEAGAITVVSPYSNPSLVAEDVMDQLATRFR